MKNALRALVLVLVVGLAAWGLAVVMRGSTQAPTAAPAVSTLTPSTQTPTAQPNAPITQSACESAGGHWNNCGSLCRGKPPGTVCPDVCIPECECNATNHFSCPASSVCRDILSDASNPVATGICESSPSASSSSSPSTPTPTPTLSVFNSADNITTLVVHAPTNPDGRVQLSSDTFVEGTSTMFENQTSWTLIDEDDLAIGNGSIYVNSPDAGVPGPFQFDVPLKEADTSTHGILRFNGADASGNGHPTGLVDVPVDFPPTP